MTQEVFRNSIETVTLTPVDRVILNTYCSTCESFSQFLGPAYEIILHSLESFENSAIKVINGFHTGRTEGAPITDLALKMLQKIKENASPEEYLSYYTTNRSGSPLKSTTIPIYGEENRIIGLLCINFYLDTPLSDFIKGMIPSSSIDATVVSSPSVVQTETHMNSAEDLIADAVRRISQEVYNNHDIATNNRNKEIIARLNADGIFNIKNAVVTCAELLGISKNTVYLHLRNLS